MTQIAQRSACPPARETPRQNIARTSRQFGVPTASTAVRGVECELGAVYEREVVYRDDLVLL